MNQAVKDDLIMDIEQTIEIKASPEKVFEGLIKHLCNMEGEPGKPPLKLKLERKPGGRWFRDLGDDGGHLWGFVQSIKPPVLLEIFGPLMISNPVACHMIARLSPIAGGTRLVFNYVVFGPILEDLKVHMKEVVGQAWCQMMRY